MTEDEYVEYADRACDDDCRGANHCGGHRACRGCGEVTCGCDLDDGLCPSCVEAAAEEADE